MGDIISLDSCRMNRQYEQFYQKCANLEWSLDEVQPAKKIHNDIKQKMIRGYMKLLNPMKYKGGES